MPFGVSETGFELKRLDDLLLETRLRAVEIFQDLVAPDDVVDTSDSSTIGRFINLFAPSDAILWEQAQLSFSALDPNAAVGPALDNVVQYGGITRQEPTFGTVSVLFTGDTGTVISPSTIVGSNTHSNTFTTTSNTILSPSSASGINVSIINEVNEATYTITYSISSTSNNVITYTADTSTNRSEILNGLLAQINSAHPLLNASIVENEIVIRKSDLFQTSNFSTSSNLSITKVAKLASARAEKVGPLSAEANSLTVIKTPILGLDSSSNPVAASEGSFRETDEELRLRFRNTKFERSTNIIDSLYSALLSLPAVENVAVYDNDTDTYINPETKVPDPAGIPPHSFTAVVLGGESLDIANTIWKNKPAGIRSVGNTDVTIIDSQGFARIISFERPTPIPIYIDIVLETDQTFPANGANQIRSAIISYAKDNFSVGDDIVYTRLYTPINSVLGHEVESLTIGTSSSPTGTESIPIDFDEIGSFESVNINITLV